VTDPVARATGLREAAGRILAVIDRLSRLFWILGGGFAMRGIAMVGGLATVLPKAWLDRLLVPLVAVAAGTLLGGAVFHMLPESSLVLGPLPASGWPAVIAHGMAG